MPRQPCGNRHTQVIDFTLVRSQICDNQSRSGLVSVDNAMRKVMVATLHGEELFFRPP